MAIGIVWMVMARLIDRSIGLVSTIMLARLLAPEDFGLVAIATAVAAILDLFGAFNFDLALIQRRKAEDHHYNTAWTFNVLFGIACALVIALGAPAIAEFYEDPRVEGALYCLAIAYVIGGFTNIGTVNFRKELDFRSEFILMFARRIITFLITLVAALIFRSYWALLTGIVAGRVASVIISFYMHTYRPRLALSGMRDLLGFSKWLLVNNLLFFLVHRGMDFVLGKTHGSASLGTYTVSYEIANLPTTDLVAPINRATFPGFSKLTERAEMADVYLRLLGMISLIIVPIGAGIGLVADPLVKVMLGEKWLEAIPLVTVLSIHGAISATQTNNGTVWMALGKTRLLTLNAVLFVASLFGSLPFLLDAFGLIGAAYAYLVGHVICVPFAMYMSMQMLGITLRQIMGVLVRPLLGLVTMVLVVLQVDQLQLFSSAFVTLLLHSLAGALVYAASCLVLWLLAGRPSGAEAYLLGKLRTVLKR